MLFPMDKKSEQKDNFDSINFGKNVRTNFDRGINFGRAHSVENCPRVDGINRPCPFDPPDVHWGPIRLPYPVGPAEVVIPLC
jgi:hypothetical protein